MGDQNKPTIFYVYDALCGWCYGFTPVIREFQNRHAEDFNFRVLSGGMVTGERVGPISEVAGYIKEAYHDVENLTGVKFGEEFLQKLRNESREIFTSVPAAMAMALFRIQQPDSEVEFASRMQNAIYYQGLPPADWHTYGTCAADFGLNAAEFTEKLQNEKLLKIVEQEFQIVSHWGVKGFPSVILQKGEQAYVVTRGYCDIEEMETILAKIKLEIAKRAN